MNAFVQRHRAALFVFGTIAILLGLCVTVVPESSQAVVLRMGDPVRVVNRWRPGDAAGGGGGLLVHLPVIEQVAWVDRGLSTFTSERVPVRSADQVPLELDTAVTFRVFDPVRLVANAGDGEKAVEQMRSVLGALAQEKLGAVAAAPLLMPGHGGALAQLREALDGKARALGVQVVDLRITGSTLPEGELGQVYERMESDRAQLAIAETQQGDLEADRIVTEAQANAARILGNSAGKDPAFYDFYRAMGSYEKVFANPDNKGATTIVLSPDSEYLKQFSGR